MYKIKNYLYFLFLGFLALATACQQDGLSEEELQNLTQSTSLTVNAVQVGSDRPVKDASITIVFAGTVLESMTDEFGQAYFDNVSQGEALIKMSKEGYFDLIVQRQIETAGRLGGDNVSLSLYSMEDAATVKGKVKLKTDLTTDEYDYPQGVKFDLIENNTVIASGTTDATGNFNIKVPTTANGRSFSLLVPELSYDQQLYVVEETGPVLKTAYGTIFRHDEAAQALPNTSNIQATISNPNYNNGRQAYVDSVEVLDGEITNVIIGEIGYGYSGNFVISIDAEDGFDAYITVGGSYDPSICNYPNYYRLSNEDITIYDGGQDYPDYRSNENVTTMHPTGFDWANCTRITQSFRIRTAEIIEVDLNYGTGTVTGEIR